MFGWYSWCAPLFAVEMSGEKAKMMDICVIKQYICLLVNINHSGPSTKSCGTPPSVMQPWMTAEKCNIYQTCYNDVWCFFNELELIAAPHLLCVSKQGERLHCRTSSASPSNTSDLTMGHVFFSIVGIFFFLLALKWWIWDPMFEVFYLSWCHLCHN